MLVDEYERVINKVPELFKVLAVPHIEEVDVAISPGLTILRWTSLNLSPFITDVQNSLNEFEKLIDSALGIHKDRILQTFSNMILVPMVEVPTNDVISIEEFTQRTEELCRAAAVSLETKSIVVETAVNELVNLLFPPDPTLPVEAPEDLSAAGSLTLKKKVEKRNKLQQEADMLYDYYQQMNISTLLRLFKTNLDLIRKRVALASALIYTETSSEEDKKDHALFVSDIVLSLPNLVMKPSLEEIQQAMSHIVQTILSVLKYIYCWDQERIDVSSVSVSTTAVLPRSQVKIDRTSHLKTFHRTIAEHKDIVKLVLALNSCLNSTKNVVQTTIDSFNKYKILWAVDRDEQVAEFSRTGPPGVSDYQQEMHSFQVLEEEVQVEPDSQVAGIICLRTEQLKSMLTTEAKQWRVCHGRAMSQRYQSIMDEVFLSIEDWTKLLSKPLKDLDDVRSVMATLKDIRENEIRIDMYLGPIEVINTSLLIYKLCFLMLGMLYTAAEIQYCCQSGGD